MVLIWFEKLCSPKYFWIFKTIDYLKHTKMFLFVSIVDSFDLEWIHQITH